jgi:membrane protein DedA with SNARE-associated domain
MPAEEAREANRGSSWRSRDVALWVLAGTAIAIAGRFAPYKPVRTFFGSFSWLTEHALHVANGLFQSYGYQTAFLAPLLENTLFIGAIIPGTIVMLLAGLSAHDGLISIWPAMGLAIIGAMIGDTISYGMGRFGAQRLGPETRIVQIAERMREPLLDHSIWLVLSYHFAGYSRMIGPAAAGFLRMPFWRWVLLDYIGVTLWVIAFLTGGYMLGVFGLSLDNSDKSVRVFEIILFIFFAIAVFMLLSRASKRQAAIEAGEASAE